MNDPIAYSPKKLFSEDVYQDDSNSSSPCNPNSIFLSTDDYEVHLERLSRQQSLLPVEYGEEVEEDDGLIECVEVDGDEGSLGDDLISFTVIAEEEEEDAVGEYEYNTSGEVNLLMPTELSRITEGNEEEEEEEEEEGAGLNNSCAISTVESQVAEMESKQKDRFGFSVIDDFRASLEVSEKDAGNTYIPPSI